MYCTGIALSSVPDVDLMLDYSIGDNDTIVKGTIIHSIENSRAYVWLERTFGVSRHTVIGWIKKASNLPALSDTLIEPDPHDAEARVLELDELWSFVLKKTTQAWIWIALCRQTRQVVAYAVGDRSQQTCRRL